MPGVRDHEPFVIEQFGGLWDRGDDESAPSDHFTQADNVQYFNSGVETRPALDKYSSLGPFVRIYDYVMQAGQSILALNTSGQIYHIIPQTPGQPDVVHGPILTIAAMEDFGFIAIAGRAYITPFKSFTNAQGIKYELGLPGEYLYVYKGDGVAARKAGGLAPSNGGLKPFTAFVDANPGVVTEGIHLFAVCAGTGNLFMLAVYPAVYAPGDRKIHLTNIPIAPAGQPQTRTILMTRAINPDNWDPNQASSEYYVATTINDNTSENQIIDIADANLTSPFIVGTPFPTTANDAMLVLNSDVEGYCSIGFHVVGVVWETDTGYLTAIGPEFMPSNTYVDTKKKIFFANIPISPNPIVKKRHLVSTKAISEYSGDQKAYQFFFIPNGIIEDNTTANKIISYYDEDLVSDASHLVDNFGDIPAGVSLTTYHSRLVLVGDGSPNLDSTGVVNIGNPDNRSVARISMPGEPEAISKVDGLIIAPLDGNPLTNAQEFRDVLYLFKRTRTYAYSDNRDEPASWQEEVIDQGVGAPVHGIATVLDSGGVNTDFLLIANWSGLWIFNGTFAHPELSWKIADYWNALDRNSFRHIQIVNDSLSDRIWITLPLLGPNAPTDERFFVLHADYGDGLDAKNIKWAKWKFDSIVTSACLIEANKLLFSSVSPYSGIYFINHKKTGFFDSYYGADLKIPDPTIRTALLGE